MFRRPLRSTLLLYTTLFRSVLAEGAGDDPELVECCGSVGHVWETCGTSVGQVWDKCGRNVGEVWEKRGRRVGEAGDKSGTSGGEMGRAYGRTAVHTCELL